MRFDIITIFPGFFAGIFEHGVVKRAIHGGLLKVAVHDLREFTHDRHRTVDDRPFGGGEGMVLKPQPIAEALASLGIAPISSFEPFGETQECQGTTSVVPKLSEDDDGALAPAEARPTVILLSAQG